jgi:hypothetical protein
MTNHFRTTLLNLPYNINARNEHIPKDFKARYLPDELQAFHTLLFAGTTKREDKIRRVNNLVSLVNSTTFKGEIVKLDTRVTYQQDNYGDGFTFTVQGVETTQAQRWDPLSLFRTLDTNITATQRMLNYNGSLKYTKQDNAVYNLANLLACFVDRIDHL